MCYSVDNSKILRLRNLVIFRRKEKYDFFGWSNFMLKSALVRRPEGSRWRMLDHIVEIRLP
jgi:hypothetical protein